ncbi:parallel beta-helix domain-containing protein [Nannocystis radixulma]|uniref:Right-handed parallel beta-helix repeat-containing protein n=1 Tax=Nannocystis radixulma TaxID=2995305 RepID=A0ABT5BB31_9BACT|nr:parallel beta-helix domain-containing protein [Nannocystis radixulma]MDC0670724.1 right-handed parallel beta-helix repeat-containing protein [Nannocystis radixulma]
MKSPCRPPLLSFARAGVTGLALTLSLGACGGDDKGDTASDGTMGTDGTVGTEPTAGTDATDATDGTAGTEPTGTDTEGTTAPTTTTGEEMPADCDAFVSPSDDDVAALQGALLDAADGDIVCMAEGLFELNTEISISANNLTLRGAGREQTILDFSAQDLGANGIKISGDGVTVQNFTVRETPGDGIRGDDVADITFDGVSVEWAAKESLESGAYGFYPVGCTGVVIRNSRVIGARDAGIYVGQSSNILVEDNEAYDNVAGIEIENSTGATLRRNHAYNNTGGILIFNLPGLPVQDGKHTLAYDNIVENNNGNNFGIPGTSVAAVPPGVGFMILASDDNELRNNMIRGNRTSGVIIVSYNEAIGLEPADDPNFDAFAEGNYIHDNSFVDNGTMPATPVDGVAGVPAPDIQFDGCLNPDAAPMDPAVVNCLWQNGDADYINFDLCGGLANKSTDLEPVTCQHTALPELPAG